MRIARRAAVTVSLRIREESILTMDIVSQTRCVRVKGVYNRLGLPNQKEAIKNDLAQFLGCLGNNTEVGFDQASRALAILHKRGRTLLQNLFCRDVAGLKSAISLFRDACPAYKRAGWDQDAPPPFLVQVDASVRDIVPFDLLPLLEYDEPKEIYDFASLARAANSFLGFSAIVERKLLSTKPSGRERDADLSSGLASSLDGNPKLRIQFFRYSALRGAHHEEQFFRNHPRVDLDGPWPVGGEKIPDFSRELTSNLLDPTKSLTVSSSRPDQITHFACHCDTSTHSFEDYTLKLAGVGWFPSQQKVTLRELQDKFHDFDMKALRTGLTRPLVFMNACGSSDVDPTGLASFPELFMDFGHRGFIGTETKMPDQFAAAFSKAFYLAFLQGEPLGDAIYRARWNCLKRFRNPLGLLYGVYANPDLFVSSHQSPPEVNVPTTA